MANWDKNKTIYVWCAGEMFRFLTPRMFWLMLGLQLNLMRTSCTSTWRQSYSNAKLDTRSTCLLQARPIRPGGSKGTWQTLTSLLQSTHSHAYIHLQAHFLSLQAVLCPSIFPASHATSRKQVFISSRWAGAWRYAPLPLVNTSSGPTAPWSKRGVGPGKLNDTGYN